MEEEEGGLRLSKRFSDQGGEVDLKTKAGTAWSHNFLNQKPWHPLSYPNQRRKWIAEQTHAQHQRRSEEVAREFAQEQEFFRQTALVSKKEKEKMEMMKAVSFMYIRPPGFNAESAKAAEIAEERRKEEESNSQPDPDGASDTMPLDNKDQSNDGKKKPRPRDVFGRALPTEEQFEVLKNAPKMETGIAGRAKPFGIELRNVKCLRCGNFGHQSGDRECPLKDAIMPNEESRLKRDDPLTAMMAHAESSEPLKWELKQRPGMSPPRGGFNPDDPNQQIVAEDIFDEYGGFLGAELIPDLLANFSSEKPKKKKSKGEKHKRRSSPTANDDRDSCSEDDERKNSKRRKHKTKKVKHSISSKSDDAEFGRLDDKDDKNRSKVRKHKGKKQKHSDSSSSDDSETEERRKGSKHKTLYGDSEPDARHKQSKHKTSAYIDSGSSEGRYDGSRSSERHGQSRRKTSTAYDDSISTDHRKQSKSKTNAYDDSGSHEDHYYDSRSSVRYRPSEIKSKKITDAYDASGYEERRHDDLRCSEHPKRSKRKTSTYDDDDDPGSEDRHHDDSRSRERQKQSKSRNFEYHSLRSDEQRKQSKHKTPAYDDSGSDDWRRSKHRHRSRHGHDRQ